MTRSFDPISTVETAYEITGTTEAWLTRVLESIEPGFDTGFGVMAFAYAWRPGSIELSSVTATKRGEPYTWLLADVHERSASRVLDEAYGGGGSVHTARDHTGLSAREFARYPPFAAARALGIKDCLGLRAFDAAGNGVCIAAPLSRSSSLPLRESLVVRATRVLVHLQAALRLRRRFRGGAPSPDRASAVLSPSGRVLHATGESRTRDAREALREAAVRIDRARSKLRRDGDRALGIWRGLADGRWSLVDHFERDGRRFLVAERNHARVRAPSALTERERQVLAYRALGHPLKLIAYELGLAESTVSRIGRDAMRKLGIDSPAELAQLFAGKLPGVSS